MTTTPVTRTPTAKPPVATPPTTGWSSGAWNDYAEAAAGLYDLRREVAMAVQAQQDAADAAQQEIISIRKRAALQQSRFADVTARFSIPAAKLEPLDADRTRFASMASTQSGDPTPQIRFALRHATATLDIADATLSTVADRHARTGFLPGWPPAARNALVYLWYALLAVAGLFVTNKILGPTPRAGLLVAACSVGAFAVSWLIAWLSVGVLFTRDSDGKRRRSSWLGLLICAIPLVVGLVLSGR